MRRFWVEKDQVQNPGDEVLIEGEEHHHLKNVARLEEGERLELLPGDGRIALAELLSLTKKQAIAKVLEIKSLPSPPEPRVVIVLSVPRFQKMDLIIQKAVELNAECIIPVVSDKSFVKTLSKDLTGKIPRWQKIALEACKQSGRAWTMKIENPSTLEKQVELARNQTGTAGLFFYEGESALDVKSALQNLKKPHRLVAFVGAEGGFSVSEVNSFQQSGFSPITMGPLVLRVETACIALLSVIQYEFNWMK